MSARQNRRRAWGRIKALSDGRIWQTGAAATETKTLNRGREALRHGGTVTHQERDALVATVLSGIVQHGETIARRQIIAEEHGRAIESRNARQSAIGTPVRHIARPAVQVGTFGRNDSPIPFSGE